MGFNYNQECNDGQPSRGHSKADGAASGPETRDLPAQEYCAQRGVRHMLESEDQLHMIAENFVSKGNQVCNEILF